MLTCYFSDVIWRPGLSVARQIIISARPRFCFIMMVGIVIYLFVLDDLLTTYSLR